MVSAGPSKGKQRSFEDFRDSSSSLSPVPEELSAQKTKRSKRAETRQCPVCEEPIPLRLLATHVVLESQRVEVIIDEIGSTDFVSDDIPGSSSRTRRSAVKARKSMSRLKVRSKPTDSLQQAGKTIQHIKRRRRQRLAKYREMFRGEEVFDVKDGRMKWGGIEITCPICRLTVRGDEDVVDAHVDACLANEVRRSEEEREQHIPQEHRAYESNLNEDDNQSATGHVGDVRGTGFHTRSGLDEDVDDELDVDGDEGFGEPQFTEGDILPVDHPRPTMDQDIEVEIESDSEEEEAQREQKTLRDLVAEGKVVRNIAHNGLDPIKAKVEGVAETNKMNSTILVTALEAKVKHLESMGLSPSTSPLCRICLDPYNEPTISIGCWHTFCRECWLRCLGSTKLCPICKRITGATDLRRIYL